MLLCLIGLFLAVAPWSFSMYRFARNGQLERNYHMGIKTRWTIASDETWEYIHRRYAFVFLGCGVLVALMPVDVAVGMVATRELRRKKALSGIAGMKRASVGLCAAPIDNR